MQDLSCYNLWDTLAGHLLRKQVFFLSVSKCYIFLLPQGKRNSLFSYFLRCEMELHANVWVMETSSFHKGLWYVTWKEIGSLGREKHFPSCRFTQDFSERWMCLHGASLADCAETWGSWASHRKHIQAGGDQRSGSWTEHLFTACSLAWVSLKYVRGAWQLQQCDHREQCGSQLNCAAMCSVSLLQHWGSSGQRVVTSWASFICTNPLVPSCFLPSQLCP